MPTTRSGGASQLPPSTLTLEVVALPGEGGSSPQPDWRSQSQLPVSEVNGATLLAPATSGVELDIARAADAAGMPSPQSQTPHATGESPPAAAAAQAFCGDNTSTIGTTGAEGSPAGAAVVASKAAAKLNGLRARAKDKCSALTADEIHCVDGQWSASYC
eukprot:GHVU01232642.1.p1 GENE.GHVU01232642.1~~GHVU01232642.1.p1  ORF type:complete len:160 (+),score=18.37 GHVU01232642.1:333-812(+)